MTIPSPNGSVTILRHPAWLRATHWINAICVIGLFMSGLQIFNARPDLYFGRASDFARPAASISSNDAGDRGLLRLGAQTFDTTGVLGVSAGPDGAEARAFPRWATLPADQDLATGRRWHFLFAWILVFNGAAYLALGLASGHIRRDIWPGFADLKRLPRSLLDHVRLRFRNEAGDYNVLQKISYAAVALVVLPGMVLAGLAMSPGMDAIAPALPELFGGRQSARSVHFILAFSLLAFFLVHVAMVVLAGPINEMRSMITGRMRVDSRGDAP